MIEPATTIPRSWRSIIFSDVGVLIILGMLRFVPLLLTNSDTGWHRDELDFLDNARFLDWGYVAYPPLTPFIGSVALALFGPSLLGVRFFCTLAQALAMILTGLTVREMGGKRWAQVLAAVAVAISPISLFAGSFLSYTPFDYLWWSLIAYLVIRLLRSDNPRWWLAIGAAVGIGMMTKFTMAYLVAGVVIGVVLTGARRYLLSPWLWGGVAIALLIFLPNLIWQAQHSFITLDFLSSIHARDVAIGRTSGFLPEQVILATNIITAPLWLAGLYYYFISKPGRPYRLLGWMFVVPFLLVLITQGRSYYVAAAYPVLFAGGSVIAEGRVASFSAPRAGRVVQASVLAVFLLFGVAAMLLVLPIAPVGSPAWDVASDLNGELNEMVGWQELVQQVADVYAGLPDEEKATISILAGNYGEAGAVNLYGPAYGLPEAISGTNSYWLRGYGNPPPETAIVIGYSLGNASYVFSSCQVAGRVSNRFGVRNEETRQHQDILLCRGPRRPWDEMWPRMKSYG